MKFSIIIYTIRWTYHVSSAHLYLAIPCHTPLHIIPLSVIWRNIKQSDHTLLSSAHTLPYITIPYTRIWNYVKSNHTILNFITTCHSSCPYSIIPALVLPHLVMAWNILPCYHTSCHTLAYATPLPFDTFSYVVGFNLPYLTLCCHTLCYIMLYNLLINRIPCDYSHIVFYSKIIYLNLLTLMPILPHTLSYHSICYSLPFVPSQSQPQPIIWSLTLSNHAQTV